MNLLQTVKTSYEEGSYVLNGCQARGGSGLALSLSNHSIRLYDVNTTAFLFDLKDHTMRVTDVVSTPSQPDLLFSVQEDSGVMVSDLRMGRAAQFFTSLCERGAQTNTIGVSPSGSGLVIGAELDLHVVDPRTWAPINVIEQIHLDEITRARFLDESTVCTAGEDQMINFLNVSPGVVDDDVLLQAIRCDDVITKTNCFPEIGAVTLIGSCENGYLCPYNLELRESTFPRPDFNTYLVDWAQLGSSLYIVMGSRDDDGNPGALRVLDWTTKTVCELPPVHTEIARVAIGFGDRLVTGGEDGMLAFWKLGPLSEAERSPSISAMNRGGAKERTSNRDGSHHSGSHYNSTNTRGGGRGRAGGAWSHRGGTGGRGHRGRGRPY